MSLFSNEIRIGSSAASDDYEIERSLRFDSDSNAYLSRTFGTNSSNTTKTFSCWIKRSARFDEYTTICATTQDGNIESRLQFANNGAIKYTDRDSSSGTTDANFYTNAAYRDCSAWYHIVLIIDTTNGTAGDRVRLYVNGDRVTSLTSVTNPAQNYAVSFMRSSAINYIGVGAASGSDDFSGYLAEVHFLDGTIKDPSHFGKTNIETGQWIPKEYTGGGYGNQGFYLNFSDNSSTSALGLDSSGVGNNWSTTNFSVTANSASNDSVLDTPTNNWATINQGTTVVSLKEGNLFFDNPNTGDYAAYATHMLKAGKKYYIEGVYLQPSGSGSQCYWGITLPTFNNGIPTKPNSAGAYSFDWRGAGGTPQIHNNGSSSTTGSKPADGSVIGMVIDLSAGKMYVHDDNSYYESGNPGAGSGAIITGISTTTDFYFVVHVDAGGPNVSETKLNFGQQGFQYQPSGFEDLLNSSNIAEPTIKDASKFFNTVTYTGNATSRNIVSGFDTGFVWIKRLSGTESHVLANSTVGANNFMMSNSSAIQNTASNCVTAFNSDGVTVGTQGIVNDNNESLASWHWKESATAGFDVVTYTGNGNATHNISHSLGVAPDLFIVKSRTNAQDWYVMHPASGANKYLVFSGNGQQGTNTVLWGNTPPISTVFTVGENGAGWATNENGQSYVAYLWASIEGFSKIGSYNGNGSTDGPYVYVGFKPAFILIRRISGGNASWTVWDNKRSAANVAKTVVWANSDSGEDTNTDYSIDILSNGFKIRTAYADQNNNGDPYLYMAFAERSFKYANAR